MNTLVSLQKYRLSVLLLVLILGLGLFPVMGQAEPTVEEPAATVIQEPTTLPEKTPVPETAVVEPTVAQEPTALPQPTALPEPNEPPVIVNTGFNIDPTVFVGLLFVFLAFCLTMLVYLFKDVLKRAFESLPPSFQGPTAELVYEAVDKADEALHDFTEAITPGLDWDDELADLAVKKMIKTLESIFGPRVVQKSLVTHVATTTTPEPAPTTSAFGIDPGITYVPLSTKAPESPVDPNTPGDDGAVG